MPSMPMLLIPKQSLTLTFKLKPNEMISETYLI